ncbi:type II restriction endonuclease [Methanobrevibacter ruminantium]|uniref:type II restriction endonuclease n=1 Tax=Methanobrevibacter ruminantium TaxID=83816 RepID=UPI002D80D2F1|nr:type II restriction endonuclease [Methanobrevibacter ruminantium]
MVKYASLGYESLDDYNQDFFGTLLETNHTYEFFVNWKKVFNNLEDYIIEISILNSLNKVELTKVEPHFREILRKYPNVLKVLPTILAIRDKRVDVLDIEENEFKVVDFSNEQFDVDEVVDFCKKSGLLDLFSKIDDLYSYLVGTEVGLDTNGRKNRSGHVFEDIVGELLAKKIKNHPEYRIAKEETIRFQRTKRWDYVIYHKNIPKYLFECNFYNGSGSKPIEVANAYVDLQNQINDSHLIFVWVTDGKGWRKMEKALKEASVGIDYIVNYNILSKSIDKILFK